MKSIRRALTLWLLAGVGGAGLVAALFLYAEVRRSMLRDFDRALVSRAAAVASLLVFDDGEVELDFASGMMPEFEREQDPEYFQVWLGAGVPFERSPSLSEGDLPRQSGSIDEPLTWDLELPDRRPGRAAGLHLAVRADEEYATEAATAGGERGSAARPTATVVVASSRAELDASLAALLSGILLAGVVWALAIVLIVALAVRRGLRPLVGLARDVEGIEARSLSKRLATSGHPRELAPLASKLNELLVRLESAFERERRMTANVAHELRTPIAELRSAADVARKWPDDGALQEEAVDAASAVARKMGEVVDALLRLSRVQAGIETLDLQPVDLSALVETLWSSFAERAEEKELQVSRRTDPGVTLRSDRQLLSLILRNLLDNAVSHSPRGGTISFHCGVYDGRIEMNLSNAPVDLEVADLDRLAEPFWQKDVARSAGAHRGLGLTLARSVAEALQGSLTFSVSEGGFHVAFEAPHESA